MNNKDGGPAFPRDHAADGHNGMTLRDYFAAHCPMQPMDVAWAEIDAKNRYRWADAMLKERAK